MTALPRPPHLPGRRLALALPGLLLAACATHPPPPLGTPALMPEIKAALQAPATPSRATAAPVGAAAVPRDDLAAALPAAARSERRFSVVLNNATPELLFMALLAETPLSVAVDPALKAPMSISLKDVTLREALELLRELHGLDYKVIGRHILVGPAQLQTRIFTVDYPSFNRTGRSDLRVLSGSITGSGGGNTVAGAPAPAGGSNGGGGAESSRVSTAQRNDLWTEIETTIKLLIGDKDGRSVVVSPQTGNIVLRALPRELRAVGEYLESTRIAVQRQVMLEAKVVEVQLSDGERSGINWAAFRLGAHTRVSAGVVTPGATLAPSGPPGVNVPIGDSAISVLPGAALSAAATSAGALLGLAVQTSNFAAVLDFLSTQGNTQVLSSPRIATLNNQKAVLKVGTDDFFVTNISTTTTAVGNTTATTPNISVQPFFSGISLDVTPNIDASGYITLHVHPAVSVVTERNKLINLGTQGTYSLPLASSDINESDAVVRARDGNIIAIGGLMRQSTVRSDSGIPGTEGSVLRTLLGGQNSRLSEKRELVILLKPTIIDASRDDGESRGDALQRLLDWTDAQPRQARPVVQGTPEQTAPDSARRSQTNSPGPGPVDDAAARPVAQDAAADGMRAPGRQRVAHASTAAGPPGIDDSIAGHGGFGIRQAVLHTGTRSVIADGPVTPDRLSPPQAGGHLRRAAPLRVPAASGSTTASRRCPQSAVVSARPTTACQRARSRSGPLLTASSALAPVA